ncbi:MAG: hypothetical protein WCF12_13350 [Propionicimonas sp.]
MVRHRPTAAAAGVLLLAGLTGCTGSSEPGGDATSSSPSPSASPTSPAPASPTPTSTLDPAQQEAFEQASGVVLAFRQTWLDLYTGARTDLNDLNDVVAAGDLLDASLLKVQDDLNQGVTAEPKNAQVVLVTAEPETVRLKAEPPTVVVQACIDGTAATTNYPDGSQEKGVREQFSYTVIKTTYLPDPGWAVLEMKGPPDPELRRC